MLSWRFIWVIQKVDQEVSNEITRLPKSQFKQFDQLDDNPPVSDARSHDVAVFLGKLDHFLPPTERSHLIEPVI